MERKKSSRPRTTRAREAARSSSASSSAPCSPVRHSGSRGPGEEHVAALDRADGVEQAVVFGLGFFGGVDGFERGGGGGRSPFFPFFFVRFSSLLPGFVFLSSSLSFSPFLSLSLSPSPPSLSANHSRCSSSSFFWNALGRQSRRGAREEEERRRRRSDGDGRMRRRRHVIAPCLRGVLLFLDFSFGIGSRKKRFCQPMAPEANSGGARKPGGRRR